MSNHANNGGAGGNANSGANNGGAGGNANSGANNGGAGGNANSGANNGGAGGSANPNADTQRKIMEKEIDLIQACITRMAQNSFMMKGWMISLVAVLLGLASEKTDMRILCALLMLATVCFWYLDAFYLRLERLYRAKYNWLIKNRLTSNQYEYDLNPENAKTRIMDETTQPPTPTEETKRLTQSVLRVMFSRSLFPLYGIVFLALLVLLVLLCVMSPAAAESLKASESAVPFGPLAPSGLSS